MSTPEPPQSIPKYIAEGLEKQGPETLRTIAEFADRLAQHKAREMEQELQDRAVDEPEEAPEDWDQDAWDDRLDEVRDVKDVPAKATLTTKTIDNRDYYYYQWREGDKIKSEYVAPVSPAR